jgi:hypothetical protein
MTVRPVLWALGRLARQKEKHRELQKARRGLQSDLFRFLSDAGHLRESWVGWDMCTGTRKRQLVVIKTLLRVPAPSLSA